MPFPSAKQLWRTTLRVIFNPGWKERARHGLELRKAVTRFQHRTVHHDLTPEILQGVPDGELIQAVVDCIQMRLPRGHVGLVPTGTGLPRGCTATYYYRTMDYDVGNGGFDQFLDASGTDVAKLTVEALQFLGLADMAEVVAEAERRFAIGEATSLCDRRYAELQPAAERQIIRFIREHPDEFTTTNAA